MPAQALCLLSRLRGCRLFQPQPHPSTCHIDGCCSFMSQQHPSVVTQRSLLLSRVGLNTRIPDLKIEIEIEIKKELGPNKRQVEIENRNRTDGRTRPEIARCHAAVYPRQRQAAPNNRPVETHTWVYIGSIPRREIFSEQRVFEWCHVIAEGPKMGLRF